MKVRNGRVLKKHNWRLEPGDYRALPQAEIRLDRRRPPEGSRHLITIADLRRFIALLPGWDEVAVGLDAIVLDSATDCAGWCGPGVVAIGGAAMDRHQSPRRLTPNQSPVTAPAPVPRSAAAAPGRIGGHRPRR